MIENGGVVLALLDGSAIQIWKEDTSFGAQFLKVDSVEVDYNRKTRYVITKMDFFYSIDSYGERFIDCLATPSSDDCLNEYHGYNFVHNSTHVVSDDFAFLKTTDISYLFVDLCPLYRERLPILSKFCSYPDTSSTVISTSTPDTSTETPGTSTSTSGTSTETTIISTSSPVTSTDTSTSEESTTKINNSFITTLSLVAAMIVIMI